VAAHLARPAGVAPKVVEGLLVVQVADEDGQVAAHLVLVAPPQTFADGLEAGPVPAVVARTVLGIALARPVLRNVRQILVPHLG